MTVGKDVSALFPDVVNCMQTDNLELKKLVYLYLMNYAKSQPDMAIMAVNTFVKVSRPLAGFPIISFVKCLSPPPLTPKKNIQYYDTISDYLLISILSFWDFHDASSATFS